MTLHRSTSMARYAQRRSAFTLLEVLVVVAIILVLASLATVGIMTYLEDAKVSKTKINLKQAENAAKSAILKNQDMDPNEAIQNAARYLEGGAAAMVDGWGNAISLEMAQDPNSGQLRPIARATGPDGTTYSSWDR